MKNCIQVSNGIIRYILQSCKLLEVLNLEGCLHVTDSAFKTDHALFVPLFGSINLNVLSLANCSQITGELLSSVIKAGDKLRDINFSKCKRINSEELSYCFHESLNLDRLNVSFSSVDDVFFDSILITQSIQILDISQCKISDKSLFIIGKYFKYLKEFYCRFNPIITDDGIKEVSNGCNSLTILELSNCINLTDKTLQYLRKLQNLERLDISYCNKISDIAIVNSSVYWKHMKEIILTWCTKIKDLSVSYLIENCHDISLVYFKIIFRLELLVVQLVKEQDLFY